jgi:oligopeptide transport system substrate-binding protein
MRLLFSISVLLLFLTACSKSSKPQYEYSGGELKMALENEPSTYITRNVSDYYSSSVLSQVMEGLVSIDPHDLTVRPQLASSWQISKDGSMYIFTLRENVLFHPHSVFKTDIDRLLTTEDVQNSIELACGKTSDGTATHAYSFLFKNSLKGSEDFHLQKTKQIEGLKITDKTISFELVEPDDNFLNKLANICAAIISKKVFDVDAEQDMIGTGPFKYHKYKQGSPSSIILIKNEDYYLLDENGFALPYLDKVVFIFENKKLVQLEMFENAEMDIIVGLPTSRITKMLEGRIEDFNSKPPLFLLYNNPLLQTNYYFFNMADERFKSKKVRQAFNYAINREKIGRDILRNQFYELGYYGIVPPISSTFRGYDFESVKRAAYAYNPEKAQKLLSEAGYPQGKGFGSVILRFNIDDIHSAVADEMAQQISQVLGINVNIDGSNFEQKESDASWGKGDIFRSAWTADYPNPETFLTNFYGKMVPKDLSLSSRVNQSRYVNPAFDELYEQARKSKKLSDQMNYFTLAEQELMKDPPIIPLWYSGDIEIVYSRVRNLHLNSLNLFDFTRVYKKDWTKEEYHEKMKQMKSK